MYQPAFSGEPALTSLSKKIDRIARENRRIPRESRRFDTPRERRVDGGKRLGARAPDIARTSIWALLRGARLASAFKMNPGEGFLIPAGFSELPMACFFAGGCGGGGGR